MVDRLATHRAVALVVAPMVRHRMLVAGLLRGMRSAGCAASRDGR